MYGVFAFVFEIFNVEKSDYCEAFGAGFYHLNNLYECFNGNLNDEELVIGTSKFHIFERENGNPVSK